MYMQKKIQVPIINVRDGRVAEIKPLKRANHIVVLDETGAMSANYVLGWLMENLHGVNLMVASLRTDDVNVDIAEAQLQAARYGRKAVVCVVRSADWQEEKTTRVVQTTQSSHKGQKPKYDRRVVVTR
jgi:hypothetical protein